MSDRLKIAIVVTSLANKGPIRVVYSIVHGARSLGLNLDFTVIYLKEIQELTFPCRTTKYSRNLNFDDFDVVHTHGIKPDLIAFLRRRTISKHVVTIHNFVFEDLAFSHNKIVSLIFGKVWLALWQNSDVLVTISEAMLPYYRAKLPTKKILAIHNGLPKELKTDVIDREDALRIQTFKKSAMYVIGTACVVSKTKGLDQVLELLKIDQKYSFILVGTGKELKSLVEKSIEIGVFNRCLFLGYRKDADRYFQYFDVFVMPSIVEGFGLTLLEAARGSVPIVCTNIPTFRELFSEQEVAFFPPYNIPAFSAAVSQVLKTKKQKVDSARRKFLDKFTDEAMSLKYYNIYRGA